MRLAPMPVYRATLAAAPSGVAGVHHTLRLMRAMIKRARCDPAIIQAAHSIIWLTPERNHHAEATALFEWVRDTVRYVQDVAGVETLTYPPMTLQRLTGDCDDQTALLCSLLEAVGYPTRLVMTGYSGNDFEHVYCQVLLGNQWVDCDPIERRFSLGDAPPNPVRVFVESV